MQNQNEKPDEIKKLKDANICGNVTNVVAAKLQLYPVTLIALNRALQSKGFMILLSWYEVADSNEPGKDMQHHYEIGNFNKDDILTSMQHQKINYIKTFRPEIDIAKVQCPHCKKMMPDQRGWR